MRFSEYIGQHQAQETFLKMATGTRMPHAMLLRGPDGAAALGFVQAMLQFLACTQKTAADSCGQCNSCKQAAPLQHPDLQWLFPYFSQIKDGRPSLSDDFMKAFQHAAAGKAEFSPADWATTLDAENKQLAMPVHEIRALRKSLSLSRSGAGYRCVVIWQANLMRPEAANALLKLLEEPPEKTIFILTLEGESILMPTIQSRCQPLQLHRWTVEEMTKQLMRTLEMHEAPAREVAQIADGSLYRAFALARQSDGGLHEVFANWMRLCIKTELTELTNWTQEQSRQAKEYHKLLLSYGLSRLRDALMFRSGTEELATVAGVQREFVRKFSAFLTVDAIEKMAAALETALVDVGQNANTQAALFEASMQMVHQFKAAKEATPNH